MIRRHLSALLAFVLGSCASQATLEVPAERGKCAGRKFTGEPRERSCFEIEHDKKASGRVVEDAKPGG